MMKVMKISMFTMLMMIMMLKKLKKSVVKPKLMNSIECGFNNMKNKKKSIKMKFTSVMLIFIIFDLEISIITPMILTMKKNVKMNVLMMSMMLTFMMMSMMYEAKIKSIKWK